MSALKEPYTDASAVADKLTADAVVGDRVDIENETILDAVLVAPTNRDAMLWRIQAYIRDNPGVRPSDIAQHFGISDLLTFDLVAELRQSGVVGPA